MNERYSVLTLTSNPRNVAQIETYLEGLIEDCKVSPDMFGNILISVTEAVTNAIMHGNQRDEKKKVCVRCCKRSDFLAFTISDEGKGFDFDHLPDPTSPENIVKLNGRGVFLMRQLSDEVIFTDNGRTVEIKFDLC